MEDKRRSLSSREERLDDYLDRLYTYIEQDASQISEQTLNDINILLNEADSRIAEFSESEMRQVRFIIRVLGAPLFERINRLENTVQRISTEYSIGAMAEEILRNNRSQILDAVTERLQGELMRTRISPQDVNQIVARVLSNIDIKRAILEYIEQTPLDNIFISNDQLQRIVDIIIRMVETVMMETMNDVDSSFIANQ